MSDAKTFVPIDKIVGEEKTVTIDGAEYTFSPLTISDYSHVKQLLRRYALEAWDKYVDSLPFGKRPSSVEACRQRTMIVKDIVQDTEVWQWYMTEEGQAYLLFQSIQKHHANVPLSECQSWILREDLHPILLPIICEVSGFLEPTSVLENNAQKKIIPQS